MTGFLFWTFVMLLAWPLLKIIRRPERIYSYPHFMTAVFAIFILPQAISLVRFPGAAPEEAVQKVLLVTCLCLGACLIGYRLASSHPVVRQPPQTVDPRRLLLAGLVFVGCGIGFSYVLGHTEIQTNEFGGWTGPATIYGFFQQLCYPGFAICLMVTIRRPTFLSLGSTLIATIIPLQSILFGRREPAALFLMTIGLTLYFRLGLKPPGWLVATGIAIAILAIPATATYRQFQLQNDWQAVRQMELVNNFKDFLRTESVLELRNAAMLIEATRRSRNYEYGAGYWNHLVFRYVPGQLLGPAFKEFLMIASPRERLESELAAMDYVNPPGSTVTAMGDSFQQFGYFGCLFFAGLGVFYRALWRKAIPRNALFAQLLYMQSCTCAMRAVTHWTLDFLPGLAYNVIFLGGAAIYASAEKPVSRAWARRRPCPPSSGEFIRPFVLGQNTAPRFRDCQTLFAQHSRDNKDKDRATQPASQKEVEQGITYGRKHRC